jgi:rhomboid protease GluP
MAVLSPPPEPAPPPPPIAFQEDRRIPLAPVRWTYVLLALILVMWVVEEALGGSDNAQTLVRLGARYNPLIAQGQYWRLLTACFLHIGVIHLLFNGYALLRIGEGAERFMGPLAFLVIYLVSGVAGNVLGFLGSRSISAGASGAIFGLLGALVAYFAVHRRDLGERGTAALKNALQVAGINLLLGVLVPGIDMLGHLGGLLGGLALGWAWCPRYEPVLTMTAAGMVARLQAQRNGVRAWGITLGVAALLVVLMAWGSRG